MADTKITGLTNFDSSNTPYWPPAPASDVIPIVDVSDTTMAGSGTTKKISINNLLSSSPTASGALTVTGLVTAGSATITGNLTVDTNTFFVDSTLNRVGIGTATPSSVLHIKNNSGTGIFTQYQDTSGINYVGTDTGDFRIANTTAQDLLRITQSGVYTFGDGLGGTRMTLNSTGLGIGGNPSYKLHVTDNTTGLQARLSSTSTSGTSLEFQNTGASGRSWRIGSGFAVVAGNFEIYDTTASANRFSIDLSGNILSNVTATAPTLGVNSQMVFNLTSNTNLRISVRGTDGTTRTANITLA